MKMMRSMDKQEEYEVDCAIDTLSEAEEIKKNPELMAKVLVRSKEKVSVLNSFAGLRKRAAEVLAKDPEEETETEDYEDDPKLRTDDDKAAIQENRVVDEKLKEMGFKKKSR